MIPQMSKHPCYPCMMLKKEFVEQIPGLRFILPVCLRKKSVITRSCLFVISGGAN